MPYFSKPPLSHIGKPHINSNLVPISSKLLSGVPNQNNHGFILCISKQRRNHTHTTESFKQHPIKINACKIYLQVPIFSDIVKVRRKIVQFPFPGRKQTT